MSTPHTPSVPSIEVLRQRFLAVLPHVVAHGRVFFRGVRCPHQREDRIAEMVAISWRWFIRMAQNGKDGRDFPTAIATFAARAVRCGRRLCGQERARDALSPVAQQRRGFAVESLPTSIRRSHEHLYSTPHGQDRLDLIEEALHDNTQTPVSDQVSFRIDFPAWLATLTDRNRRIIDDLMIGERTLDVADRYGLCPGRISQLRREFCQDWRIFSGDDLPTPPSHRPGLS